MMIGWSELRQEGSVRRCPALISDVYEVLQRPDPWTALSEILLNPEVGDFMDMGEVDASHWWVTPDAKLEEDAYYKMGVSLLEAAAKGVRLTLRFSSALLYSCHQLGTQMWIQGTGESPTR